MEIVHISSVHHWGDTRIFCKMCRSLAEAGHRAHFVVPRSEPAEVETRDGVVIHGVPLPRNRLRRVTRTAPQVLRRAADIQADVYHIHDPELLWYAGAFQRRVGRPVVYDVHEDLRLQVYNKSWLPPWGRKLMSWAAGRLEDHLARRVAGVVPVTTSIARRFNWHPECVLVQNLPIVDEMTVPDCLPLPQRPPLIAYVGSISRDRGACQMAKAITLLPKSLGARLVMIGSCRPAALEDELRAIAGPQIELLGIRSRRDVAALLAEAYVGMITVLPIKCFLEAQSTKMLEYMSAGIPVVASDFPFYRKTVDGFGCGLSVDPQDPQAIADAILWLLEHPEKAQEMGRRGLAAVSDGLNWQGEFQLLLDLYGRLAGNGAPETHGPHRGRAKTTSDRRGGTRPGAERRSSQTAADSPIGRRRRH